MVANPRAKSGQNHFANLSGMPQQNQSLQCLVCSGRSYEECYRNGILRTCPQQENSCFLEVRYQGSRVSSVQSGCQQEVACINNMKQNFFDFSEFGAKKGNPVDSAQATHDCKLFTGHRYGNSVCRNCCFDNMCTDGWQPATYDEWNISKGSEVEKQMMLFDQFSRPAGFFAEQRQRTLPVRTQVIRDQHSWNRAPTWADLDAQRNEMMDAMNRAKKQPKSQNMVKNPKKPAPKKPHFNKPNSIDLTKTSFRKPTVVTRSPATRKPATTRTVTTRKITTRKPLLNKYGRPVQNRPGFRLNQQKPTQKPTTKALSDDDFMNLIAKLEVKNTKTVEKKVANKKSPKSSKKKSSSSKPQLKMAMKATTKKVTTTEAPTTKAPTTTQAAETKKGPWSHLPLWKQRQLMAARKRKIAAFKAAKAAKAAAQAKGGKLEAAPQMMKFSQWAPQPEDKKATFEEGPIIEVESSLSDSEFSELISSLDTKSDTDIARLIQSKEAKYETETANESENAEQH